MNVRVPVAQKDRLAAGVTVTVAGTQGGDPLTGTVTTVGEFSQESTLGSVPGYDGSMEFGDTAVSGPAEGDNVVVGTSS